ncbi:MAG TPA: DUF2294 domain-containing protein [Candidatus Obscuribacterales bacterium]
MDRFISQVAREQLEQVLSQRIQALYRNQLGHQPRTVTCQLFDEKLAIVIEGSLTKSEQLLLKSGQVDLVQEMRSDLELAIQPQIKKLIEEVMNVPVIDLLCDATLETGRTGAIAVLATTPQLHHASSTSTT